VISVAKGFKHSSIPEGERIIKNLGDKSGLWTTDFARTDEELKEKTTFASLKKYSVVVFNNTTGDLPLADKEAFLRWVKEGGAVYGIHAATDTFHNWPEFIEMMGGEFKGHGPQSEVEFLIIDPNHPATKGIKNFKHTEEIYQFNVTMNNWLPDKVRVLIALDKHPNTGRPGFYPISWVRSYGKGRVFYTAIGHREDLMQTPEVQAHYFGAMKWALGIEKGETKPLPPPPPVTKQEKQEGFIPLFDGVSLKGWHCRVEGRTPWTVQHGMLVMGDGGSDLISDQKFQDFIIRYEYMIPKGGNSGVYLRGRYEIQILDDFGNEPSPHGNGAIYGKIAPSTMASKPAGEWQTVEAKLIGNRVTVILNGIKVIDNQPIDGPTGGALDDKIDQPGPIMLQGDHGPVAYRNIRIKPL
jgi:type 1 glutamine amidotransferase